MNEQQADHLIRVLDSGVDALRDIHSQLFSIWLALWLIFAVLAVRAFLLHR